jgi:hypothetical protein
VADEFPLKDDALRKIVKKARATPVPFGFNPGTSDDDDEYLAAHLRKTPEVLGKRALNEGAGTKSAFGTFRVERTQAILTCFRTIPLLAKRMKRYLKQSRIVLNVVVTDPDGNVIDTDVETLTEWFDEPDEAEAAPDPAPEPDAADDAPDPAADPAELAARLAALRPVLAAAPAAAAAQVGERLARTVGLIRAGRLAEAEAAVSRLELAGARIARLAEQAAREVALQAEGPEAGARRARVLGVADRIEATARGLPGAGPLIPRIERARERAGEPAAVAALRAVQARLQALQAARARWKRAEALAGPMVRDAARAGAPREIAARWAEARGHAAQGDYDRAMAAMGRIAALLRDRAGAG